MGKQIINDCEYVYLKKYTVDQFDLEDVTTSGTRWDIRIKIECDMLDANKNRLDLNLADKVVTVSGSTTQLTVSDITSTYADDIGNTINNYLISAKEEFANYTTN